MCSVHNKGTNRSVHISNETEHNRKFCLSQKKLIWPHKTRLHFNSFLKTENRYLKVKIVFLSNQNHLHPPAASSFLTFASLAHSLRTTRFNPLTPNDHYIGRTASLTSKRCILYIYSTNIGTEYFKHGIYSPFFSLQNAVCFIILTIWFLYYSHFIYRVC